MFLPEFVCLCVSKITQKVMEESFWNFQGMPGLAKTTSDSILGVIRKESWILDHFEIFLALNGEYAWRRSALSECFSSWSSYRQLQTLGSYRARYKDLRLDREKRFFHSCHLHTAPVCLDPTTALCTRPLCLYTSHFNRFKLR